MANPLFRCTSVVPFSFPPEQLYDVRLLVWLLLRLHFYGWCTLCRQSIHIQRQLSIDTHITVKRFIGRVARGVLFNLIFGTAHLRQGCHRRMSCSAV